MGLYAIKLPDIGEGVAEAEIVEWHVGIGELVKQDEVVGGQAGGRVGSATSRSRRGRQRGRSHNSSRGAGLNAGGHDRRTRRTVGPAFRPGSGA